MLIPARSAAATAAQPSARRSCGAAQAAQDRRDICRAWSSLPIDAAFAARLYAGSTSGILQQGGALGYPASSSATNAARRWLPASATYCRCGDEPQARRALIVGGSMSGLFAALYLRRRGWDVDVLERSPVPPDRARGRHHDASRDAPRRWPSSASMPAVTSGCRSSGAWCWTADGSVVAERACPQTATSWNRLFELLSAAFGGRALPPGQGPAAACRRRRTASPPHFADGSVARRRPADRRRRLPLERAGAGPARRRSRSMPATSPGAAWSTRRALASVLPRADLRQPGVLPAAGRAVPGLSGRRAWQRPARRAPQLEHRLVPPRRRGNRAAAAADRRGRPHCTSCRSRRRSSPAASSPRCAPRRERLLPPQLRAVVRLIDAAVPAADLRPGKLERWPSGASR